VTLENHLMTGQYCVSRSECYGTSSPKTSTFFSGNRLPLATESSIELHMSFLASSFFVSAPEPVDVLVYVENLFAFAVMFDSRLTAALGRGLLCRHPLLRADRRNELVRSRRRV
jgi:hypothetical protein